MEYVSWADWQNIKALPKDQSCPKMEKKLAAEVVSSLDLKYSNTTKRSLWKLFKKKKVGEVQGFTGRGGLRYWLSG